jgi:hypothetical protein
VSKIRLESTAERKRSQGQGRVGKKEQEVMRWCTERTCLVSRVVEDRRPLRGLVLTSALQELSGGG